MEKKLVLLYAVIAITFVLIFVITAMINNQPAPSPSAIEDSGQEPRKEIPGSQQPIEAEQKAPKNQETIEENYEPHGDFLLN